ncbi:phosphotriesterase [Mesomycoplasma hyopneumoniae]|uniref:Phosphotriesterase n=1 Tax=Mesomycoplasma hyopneumoniae TaxID=2099 RepID=A0ABD4SX71_MESHO|nr:phosphotriesterase [Mesomycoplasma hyopneumoniae]MCI8283423.1 phosphotriesterase [Mesomycoplasma hyopneumoniae]MCI8298353.1 phosphotriesterase [Mesomycoplasma hyopneumoniae]MXR09953.1 phosphotriesterase [Mesomycoplasma hyopneumoniae]MXR44141.1 phosphotriesterase [Mesomycoplasma hyopneumoniae]QEA02553.1 phosphotriesterase [Mesomycoplasma hyopneumoniae]
MDKFSRTVLGDIHPSELGVVDCHDHLIKNYGPEAHEHPDFVMLSNEAAIAESLEYASRGGKTIVTMDPPNVGRDVYRMLEIAKALEGKVHIIMATGFHKAAFYDKGASWLALAPTDEIVKMVVAEITQGMDEYNYSGPVVRRSKAKAGIIKAGTGYGAIDRLELKSLEVAARASIETGAPILVHTQLGTMAYEAAKYLIDFGANPRKIQISHLNKNPDKYYYAKIIKELGVSLCFDGPDRVKYFPDATLAENIKYLVDLGLEKHITLSLDAGRVLYQRNYGKLKGKWTFGLTYLFDRFIPLLEQVGISKETINNILVNNPAEILAFDQPRKFDPSILPDYIIELKKSFKI